MPGKRWHLFVLTHLPVGRDRLQGADDCAEMVQSLIVLWGEESLIQVRIKKKQHQCYVDCWIKTL